MTVGKLAILSEGAQYSVLSSEYYQVCPSNKKDRSFYADGLQKHFGLSGFMFWALCKFVWDYVSALEKGRENTERYHWKNAHYNAQMSAKRKKPIEVVILPRKWTDIVQWVGEEN